MWCLVSDWCSGAMDAFVTHNAAAPPASESGPKKKKVSSNRTHAACRGVKLAGGADGVDITGAGAGGGDLRGRPGLPR